MSKKKKASFFKKYINGTKGVISLFLAILMVPFITIAGALLNAARLNSAIAVFDEALCNASNSALGTYDDFIRSRFGLMAISQDPNKAATQLGASAVTYTSQDFIQELFEFYMEENLGSLSATYDTTALTATGVYPLGDPDVLRASILQASKITVPAKLAVEWGSIEDFMAMVTKPFSKVSAILNAASGGIDVVTAVDKLSDSREDLEEQIEACNTARSEYNTAHTAFKTAAEDFNSLVDLLVEAKNKVDAYRAEVNRYTNEINQINTQIRNIEDSKIKPKEQSISGKRSEINTLKKDKKTDHTDEIAKLEKDIEDLQDEIDEIRDDEIAPLEQEKAPKETAKRKADQNLTTWNNTLQSRKNQYSGKRNAVVEAKSDYRDKVEALQEEIEATSELALGFQDACMDLVSKAEGFIKSTTTAGITVAQSSIADQKQQIGKENEAYQKQYDAYTAAGDTERATHYYNLIQENNSTILNLDESNEKYSNTENAVSSAVGTMQSQSSELTAFANRELANEYREIYNALGTIRTNLDNLTIPNDYYTKISYSESRFYKRIVNPVEKATVGEIIDNIESQIVNNSAWTVLKTIVDFISALFDFGLLWDPDLVVNINRDHYNTSYSVENPYAEEDAAKALEYKKVLNTYGAGDTYEIAAEGESDADKIKGYIDTIKANIDPFKLKNLKPLWEAATGLINLLIRMCANIISQGIDALIKGLRDRFLLVGYASYYTANRTTYKGSSLTGAGFNLPTKAQNQDYCFSGAEMEYVLNGFWSEEANQTLAFFEVMLERMVFNISGVLSDPLVQSLAAAVGAVTFGIGDVVVKILYLALEALVDTVLLAGGGDIPIIKSCVYLSPTGMPKLLEDIFSMTTESMRKKMYEKSTAKAVEINNKTNEFASKHATNYSGKTVSYDRYDDYKAGRKEIDNKNEILDMFRMDYTKSLQLFMLLFPFCTNNKMVERLMNVIEMEATYNAKVNNKMRTYDFNIDKSYTYIRAAGQFSSGVFMKVGEESSYTSKNRVIYNGY